MENLSGNWSGALKGPTNLGSMAVELSQNNDRLFGYGHFNEPDLGSYNYHIQGSVQAEEIKLSLTPDPDHSPTIALGVVQAKAKLQDEGKIVGNWSSSIGTAGDFILERVPSG